MKETKNVLVVFVASKFSDLILWAFHNGELETIRLAYLFHENGVIDDDLAIHLPISDGSFDLELMEKAVRFLLRKSFQMEGVKREKFRVQNCPENLRDYTVWFIKFFAFQESEELFKEDRYNPETPLYGLPDEVFSSKFIPYHYDTLNRWCLHSSIQVSLED